MSERPEPLPEVVGTAWRIRLLYAMAVLLVLGPITLGFLASRPDGVEWLRTLPHGATIDESLRDGDCRIVRLERSWSSSELEDTDLIKIATTLNSFQMTVVILVVALGLLYFYPLGPILRRLVFAKVASVLVAVEILFVFWLVYGGMASMGMPGLFWNENAVTEMMAAIGVTLFGFWMLYLLFVRDFEAYRHQPERRIWSQVFPVLDRSGLPRLLRRQDRDASADEQLGWFLIYAGLPLLVLMALPGVLPAARPLKVAAVVEWPWLGGLALGAMVIAAIVWARVATRLHVLWRQVLDRRVDPRALLAIDPNRLDPHANLRNIWLILSGIFLISYIPFIEHHKLSPAAFSICIMLGVLATFSIWLSMMKRWTRVVIVLGVLTLLALSGGLDYEVTLDDLKPWYPSAAKQLGRRLSADRSKPASYGAVVDLADHQRSLDRPSEAARADGDHKKRRRDVLDRWRDGLRRRGETRPILVVVTTSGGALRAAVWTEVVLKELERAIPEFPGHIRLITGASGGMLGAADYVGELAESKAGRTDTGSIRIGSDYLSPIAWQIAFRDFFPNSLLPWATYNRGQALQDAWCRNSPRLNLTFGQLRPLEEAGRIPSIVFSPMMVEDGRRLLISNLPLGDLTKTGGSALLSGDAEELRRTQADPLNGTPAPDAYDLEYPDTASVSAVEFFDVMGGDSRDRVRLASAVRMSATFPFVTSAVVLPTDPPRHVVDAGYYDNYGVNLAASWIASHGDWIKENASGVLVVQIRAFRNEKRLKLLDEDIHSPPKPPEKRGRLSRWMHRAAAAARFLPEFVSLVQEGVQSVVIPVEGVAKARESSMFFRNDEQLFVLQELFRVLKDDRDPEFFRTVIFTCDTLQFGQASQNVETLNWYIDTQEFNKIRKNMRLVKDDPNGRDRNALRLESVKSWWNSRSKSDRARP